MLYCVQHILYAVLYLFQAPVELRQLGVLLCENVEYRIGNVVNEFVVHHNFHNVVNDGVLYPIFLYRLFVATLLSLCVGAFVIAVYRSCVAAPAFTHHKCAAFPQNNLVVNM